MASDQPIEVGYWTIRGLGAPCRMMVMFAGAPLKAACYDLVPKEGGGFDPSAWFDTKPALRAKNPLMNLPYVIDGDRIISQVSSSILSVQPP